MPFFTDLEIWKVCSSIVFLSEVKIQIILFDAGEKNRVFRPEGMQTMEKVLKELHPNQDYRLILLEEYGHIDGIIGKYAASDLWPEVLSFLDMHSQGSTPNDEGLAKVVAQTMHQLELIGSTADLSEELRAAICHDTTDFGFHGKSFLIPINPLIGMFLGAKQTHYGVSKFVSLVFLRHQVPLAARGLLLLTHHIVRKPNCNKGFNSIQFNVLCKRYICIMRHNVQMYID